MNPSEVSQRLDIVDGVGVTALCPGCGIDSVIGSAPGYAIETWFLTRMNGHWIGEAR